MSSHASIKSQRSKRLVWALVILLGVLHHDFWWWDSDYAVLGFMPIGLAYHALYSILAACVWAMAVRFAWPAAVERWADESDSGSQAP